MQRAVGTPLANLLEQIPSGASVLILGCGGCATSEHFGGEDECRALAEGLIAEGVEVAGVAVPPPGNATCDPRAARSALREAAEKMERADVILLLACPQGEAALSRLTDVPIIAATQLIVGGPTGGNQSSVDECNFCDECIAEAAGGLCPYAFCPKHLINGPCGGAQSGRCEVSPDRPCVWELIYRRLKSAARLDLLERYHRPVSFEIETPEAPDRKR